LIIKQRLENFRPFGSAAIAVFAENKQVKVRKVAMILLKTGRNEKRLNMIFLLYDILQINLAQLAAGH
jgi:hypothetical protein